MPDRRRAGRSTLPDQRTLLSWLFVGRLVLAIGILLGAAGRGPSGRRNRFCTVAVIVALVFTGYGAWHVFLRGRQARGNGFLMVQALVDLGVVTTIVQAIRRNQ